MAIVRALVHAPGFVVLDEAVSALDLVTQARVLALLRRLQDATGVGYLFVFRATRR